MILVVEHLVFSDEFVAPDDQMGFHDQIQLFQQVFDLLRAFDVDDSGGMAELDLHEEAMISPARSRDQAYAQSCVSRRNLADSSGDTGLM